MPARSIGPGAVVVEVLSGQRDLLMLVGGAPRYVPGQTSASMTDLHRTYRDAVRNQSPTTARGGQRPRVMTYHSFVVWFRFARRLALVEEVGAEPVDPVHGDLRTVKGDQVVVSTRKLFSLTSGGADPEAWKDIRKSYQESQ